MAGVKENTAVPYLLVGVDEEQGQVQSGSEPLNALSIVELYDNVYPPKRAIVDNLLYNGTYLFAGAPKVGKSFFMAQLGYHISEGIPLWNYPVNKGSVLYLALEDDFGRLQKRLSRMFDMQTSKNFYLAIRAKTLKDGLENQLTQFVETHKEARLINIDTLQKIREVSGEKFSYASDYEIVSKLKQFSDTHGICLLIVHHIRKMESSDIFEMISGTTGLLGAADGAFIMQKEKRTDNRAELGVVGRDQQDQKLILNFNRELCLWELIRSETELWQEPADPMLETIAALLSVEQPQWSGTATELLRELNEPDLQPNVLTRKLNTSLDRLLSEYDIQYETKRKHSGRMIKLTLLMDKDDGE